MPGPLTERLAVGPLICWVQWCPEVAELAEKFLVPATRLQAGAEAVA